MMRTLRGRTHRGVKMPRPSQDTKTAGCIVTFFLFPFKKVVFAPAFADRASRSIQAIFPWGVAIPSY